MNFHCKLLLSLASIIFGNCYADVFTAMSDISRLLTTEGEMIRSIENYIHAQEERLTALRRDLIEMERVHEIAVKSPESFIANPLNAYLLIKRLTVDWGDLKTSLCADLVCQAMLHNLTSITQMISFPDIEDLNGAVSALTRLQDTYKLNTSDLAAGNVMGLHAYRELATVDCFELGRQNYNTGDFYHTMLWMNEALKKHAKETSPSVDHFMILEYLAFATYKEGNVGQALKLTNDLLDEKPDHELGLNNKVHYEKLLQEEQLQKREDVSELIYDEEAGKKESTIQSKFDPPNAFQLELSAYKKLCRGEGKMSSKISKSFTCFYQYGPADFLRLAPVKVEVAYLDPIITIYHDVLYDNEIANIKDLATPQFQNAVAKNDDTRKLETISYRICKTSWLKTGASLHVNRVNQRIEQITGLNLEFAEDLQIANYGIGGHYEPHFDFARFEMKESFIGNLQNGNRIATLLFYMSDVEAGGATVFPRLDLTLWPEKGAAAFWYNLHPNGKGDDRTYHGACPVVVGSKWVVNKWIRERGQEFLRPCS